MMQIGMLTVGNYKDGSRYWADQNENFYWILDYYYNNSPAVGGGNNLGYFMY
jgi:hypothetical protein